MTALQVVLVWLAITSVIAFLNYGWDKGRAQKDRSRVPERRLLTWGTLGGAPGAILAMFAFRHKIRKPSFWIANGAAIALWAWVVYSLSAAGS